MKRIVLCLCLAAGVCGCERVDLSTPRASSRFVTDALLAQDMARAKTACIVENDEQAKALESLALLLHGCRQLEEAAAAKYGEVGRRLVRLNDTDPDPLDLFQRLEDAEAAEKGDEATFEHKATQTRLMFRRVKGQWMLDVPALARQHGPQYFARHRAIGEAAAQTAAEIAADKHPTLQDAQRAIGSRWLALVTSSAK